MKASELDRLFDEGEVDVVDHFDFDNASRPNAKQQKTKTSSSRISNAREQKKAVLGAAPR